MIAFPEMLVAAAEKAGIKMPENIKEYEASDFPHWHVYQFVQLGTPCPTAGCHWDNAKVIADVSDNEIKKVTVADLLSRGFSASF